MRIGFGIQRGLWPLLLLAACGGWRYGFYSEPYFAGTSPRAGEADSPSDRYERQWLELPGLSIHVNLRNDVQTADTAWVTVVPVHVDLKDRPVGAGTEQPDRFCFALSFRSLQAGIFYRGKVTRLTVDGTHLAPAEDIYRGAITGARDPITGHFLPEPPPRPVQEPVQLAPGAIHRIDLCFAGMRPSPDRQIELDLGRAITAPELGVIPPIKFQKTRYRAPYS